MANITVTFTITEFCLHTGVTEEELNEIVGLGVIEPYEDDNANWQFDESRGERGSTRATLA
ncbi:chaperone-modulator protein CbpM [Salmonella enterica subsp. arizonae]|uniref:Chaperone-modulator protein CbpM n=1 Tax=Salmonella enterica subsp. arizonae TaxID=59203 RepID=A0A379TDV3_SALER|nr:chaperone-modulator protein CbpM [Salmonella enterica subsp. arizonae]